MRIRRNPDRAAERLAASEVGWAETPRGRGGRPGTRGRQRGTLPLPGMGGRSRRRTGIRRFLNWRAALLSVASLGTLMVGGFTVLYVAIDIPQANDLARAQSNVYFYSDGTRLTRTGDINRESVPLDRVPLNVRRAFVAAENKDFYSDSGVSLSGTARGIFNTVTGKGKQGGSTITQQYVKNYYLSQEQTVTRKVQELVIALKVDRQTSKDDILAGYLNTSFYGRQAYGVQAAARAYYGKEAGQLTVEEGAYLAALLQAPSQYDWAAAGPEGRRLVMERWGYVLDNMVEEGWLDGATRQRMRFAPPLAPKPVSGLGGRAGYLVEAARRELMASGISEQELAGGGWRITLNIDPARQRALEQAVATGGDASGVTGPSDPSGPSDADTPAGTEDADQQAGAVSVDPRSGRILALYGGRDYLKHFISNATRSDYQAGPTFGPVALAAKVDAAPDQRGTGRTTDVFAHVRQTAVELGMNPQASGFTSPRSTSLGLMGVSPMEMAGVYATLANEGRKVTPSIVKSAQRGDESTNLPPSIGGQAVSAEAAGIVTGSLGSSFARADRLPVEGAAASAQPVAFVPTVTGPSDDRKAEWYISFSPELVTSLALFGEDARTQKQVALKGAGEGNAERIWSMYTAMSGSEVAPDPVGSEE
ncbi:transglycosylase domain-containing protein [Streptomyces sp. NPDC002889]|uniref:transglycosylase domain-containing protein n=1 Tax=Streptomyces sp. NPDC002889 TaxID=3364669 RepID=UPI00368641CB